MEELNEIVEGKKLPDEILEGVKHTGYLSTGMFRALMCVINIAGYFMILS